MRLNRGTVLLLAFSLVVIIAVLLLTINQATAPGEDSPAIDAEATPVVLFPGVDESSIARLEIRDDLTGQRTVLLRSSEGQWSMDPPDPSGAQVDQAQVSGLATTLFALESQESFEADDLAQYGMDQPLYSVYTVADDGAIHVMHIGNQNPAGSRFYAVVEQIAPGTTRPDLELMQPLADATEAAGEAETSATEAATAEATDMIPELQDAEIETSLETLEADVIDAIDATPGPDLTAEATSEATTEPVQEPLVSLEGPQTIYLVNAQPIRTLIGLIFAPPLAQPTAQPTVEAIIPADLTQEAGEMDAVLPAAEATSEATETMATAEATAAP